MAITKPLAYIGEYGTPDQNFTDLYCPLTNDMDGSDDKSNKTLYWLKYGYNQYISGSQLLRYIYPLINSGTLTYVGKNLDLKGPGVFNAYVIDHGDGYKTHYQSYFPLSFSNGSSIENNSVGHTFGLDDYIQLVPLYFNATNVCIIAIEYQGAFINPRSIDATNKIPSLYTEGNKFISDFKGQLSWYINPITVLDTLGSYLKDNESLSNFNYANSTFNFPLSTPIILKEEFFNIIPENLRGSTHIGYVGVGNVTINNESYQTAKGIYVNIGSLLSFTIVFEDLSVQTMSQSILLGLTSLGLGSKLYNYDNKTGADQTLGTWYAGEVTSGISITNSDLEVRPLHMYFNVKTAPFEPDPGEDPDEGGGNQNWGQGNTTTSTSGGDFTATSDTIETGTSLCSKGGIKYNNYYALNLDHIMIVKNKIWGFSIPFFTKPSEAIISLMMFPFNFDNISVDTGDTIIQIGNSVMGAATPETQDNHVYLLNTNYSSLIDFGSFKLSPYFGGFQDFYPFTKIKIYLPFIGEREIDPQYVQDKTLSVKYYVNMTNGSCIACIFSDGKLYNRYNGFLAQTVPLTQVDNNVIEAATTGALQASIAIANPAIGMATIGLSSLSTVSSMKPSINGSAGGGGEAEWSLPLECYLIIERPQCAIAQTYNAERGRPSLVNKQLSKCKGFTKMANPRVTAKCTQTENDMINSMLKEGVIINV